MTKMGNVAADVTGPAAIEELTLNEIESVGGAYSKDTCVQTWSVIGMVIGGFLTEGLGVAVGGIIGAWYGSRVCRAS